MDNLARPSAASPWLGPTYHIHTSPDIRKGPTISSMGPAYIVLTSSKAKSKLSPAAILAHSTRRPSLYITQPQSTLLARDTALSRQTPRPGSAESGVSDAHVLRTGGSHSWVSSSPEDIQCQPRQKVCISV